MKKKHIVLATAGAVLILLLGWIINVFSTLSWIQHLD